MTIAYFDCFSGASGDMILGALVDAGLDLDHLRGELTKLPLNGYRIERRRATKHAIVATKIDVVLETTDGDHVIEGPGDDEGAEHHDHAHPHDHTHEHPHTHHDHPHEHHHPHEHTHAHAHEHGPTRHIRDLLAIIDRSTLAPSIRERASAILDRLAAAEGVMHGMPKEDVHLHEVSGVDAMVDIVGACIGLHLLGINEVHVSALPIGSGFVRCAHGRMPVPAPGALELLRGVPVYQTQTRGELVTPTGAAILTTLASGFGPMPRMVLQHVGYGAGTKDFAEQPNLLRVCIGEKG